MAVTITLTDALEERLRREAETQHRSLEELVLSLLSSALEADEPFPTPETVVEKIQATSSHSAHIRPATRSLAEVLHSAPEDPDLDLDI